MISVLVAFRDTDDGWRGKLWRFLLERLERELPDAEVCVGTDDGELPFNKCQALNRAASWAKGDILYVLDADCYVPGEQVRAAAEMLVRDGAGWVKPWHRKVKLSQVQTQAILETGEPTWTGRPDAYNTFWSAPPLMLLRETWEDVGGMDERFRGWGGEDNAFARTLWKLGYGFARSGRGDCLHLWHPRIGEYGKDLWPGQTELFPNRPLDLEYNAANTPAQMRELIARRSHAAVRLP